MTSFQLRSANVTAYLTANYLGFVFKISRPVEINGQRRRSGWMLSVDGQAMALFEDCDLKLVESYCNRKLRQWTDHDSLKWSIEKTIADQTKPDFKEFNVRSVIEDE